MEESINQQETSLLSELHRVFGERTVDLRTYSPLTLAYIGDAVFEIIIRTLIVEKGQQAANMLHKCTTKIVCAQTQAKMADTLKSIMTEQEQDIYRRGKNTKLHSKIQE